MVTMLRRALLLKGGAGLSWAAIAQLVEHIIRNDGVGGSNPSCGTSDGNMAG